MKKFILIPLNLLLITFVLGVLLLKSELLFIFHLKDHYVDSLQFEQKKTFKVSKIRPNDWITLSKKNELQAKTIVISEDWEFYNHSGVDLNQIKATIIDYLFLKKRLRGASTITQQLIKNLFLTNERTLSRKIKELTLSLYMERILSKKKILETYLNVIEYGPSLYGIKNASNHYFDKEFDQLSLKEAAFIAMLLPNPKKNSKSYRIKKLTPYAKKTIDQILNKLVVARIIPEEKKIMEVINTINFNETL